MEIFVAPSILSADFAKMGDEVQNITACGADMIHCDVMDGIFVPNITFGPKMVKDIRKHTTLPLDVHLMIVEPIKYIKEFVNAGADYITVHYEACSDVKKTLEEIKNLGVKSGLVISPDTDASVVEEFLPLCDMVLVMSVYPGFGGQKFIPASIDKLVKISSMIKKINPAIRLEIDGGINKETATLVIKAGADTLVAGSAVFGASDRAQAINDIKNA